MNADTIHARGVAERSVGCLGVATRLALSRARVRSRKPPVNKKW